MPSITTMPISRRQDQRDKQLLKQLEPLLHQPVQTYRNGGTYVQDGTTRYDSLGLVTIVPLWQGQSIMNNSSG